MRSLLVISLVLGAVGCDGDSVPFRVSLVLETGESQPCTSEDCETIPMSCNATVLVRVVDADDENTVYVSECFEVEGQTNLCSLASVNLGDDAIPNTRVRIQFAVWPAGVADDCPRVDFDAAGKAKIIQPMDTPMPAIAGASYFEVGSSAQTELVLGCIDQDELDACAPEGVTVDSRVIDFETNLSVAPTIQNLIVSMGEPQLQDPAWTLPPAGTIELDRTVEAGFPIWHEPDRIPIDIELDMAACIQVFEDGVGPVSASLSCQGASPDTMNVDVDGVLVRKSTLDQITAAVGGSFPPSGLVLGRVVDHAGQFASGVSIAPSAGTVQFLNADMTALDGGGVTTSSGAFLSLDAPFDTTWEASLGTATQVEVQLGGLVTGKVTVIELQLSEPVIVDP